MKRISTIGLVLLLLFSFSVSAEILDYASSKSNAMIVIGADATAEDVIGSLGLATGIYADLSTGTASPLAQMVAAGMITLPDGYYNTVYVAGDVVRIDSSSDRLESVEKFGNVKPVLGEDDTPSLASGRISTQKGTTEYKQYLRFETTTDTSAADYVKSGYISLKQDDDDIVNIYMIFDEDSRIFEYEIDFEGGLKAEIECVNSGCNSSDERKLSDLESLKLNLLGSEFMILKARVNTEDEELTLDLVVDGISAIFEEGETQTFTVGGKEYEITALIISDSSNKVKFSINGKTTKEFEEGDIERTIDDLYLGVSEVLPNEAGEVSTNDLVKILLGTKRIEFKDTNYTDDVVSENIEINDETIHGTEIKIRAVLESEDTFKINNIKYALKAESSDFGTVYVPAGYTLKQKLRYPEAMLTDNWDIRYYGASPDAFMHANRMDFMPQGDKAYKLKFINTQGLDYNIPFVDNSDDEGLGFRYGDEDKQLRFYECTSTTDFCIIKDDYFILTDSKGGMSAGSDTSVTRILQYDSVDEDDNIIMFEDPAVGSLSSTYSGTEGSGASGDISIGGKTYTFYVGASPDYNISFDQNDDGDISSDEVNIVIMGGGILDLGPNQTADQNTSALDSFNVTLTTLADNFDENGWLDFGLDDVMVFEFDELDNNEVDVDMMATLTGISKYKFPDDDAYFGSNAYGAFALESDDSGDSDYIKLTYPETQGFPQVYLTFGEPSVIPLSIFPMLGPIPLETFLDEPAADVLLDTARAMLNGMVLDSQGVSMSMPAQPEAGQTTRLDSEVTLSDLSAKTFVVLLGGPCVNDYVAQLAGEGLVDSCDDWQDLEGKSLLQSVETSFGPTLIVAGYSGVDTIRASYVLQNIDLYREHLDGKSAVFIEQGDGELVFT